MSGAFDYSPNSEVSIVNARANVMVYDNLQKKWLPSGECPRMAKVQVYHHAVNNTYRIVGRKIDNHAVLVNTALVKGLHYHVATERFHQWRSVLNVYGLNFASSTEAEHFGNIVRDCLAKLASTASREGDSSADLEMRIQEDEGRRVEYQGLISGTMPGKLSLSKDFTRFINDETFPFRVTVYIGDERILCSGVLLAQHSKVLERKFREDNGVLMFEELLEVENNKQVLHDCIAYLHGADLLFTRQNLQVVLKFSSWYEIKDLFQKAMNWLSKDLNGSKSVKLVVQYLIVSNSLNSGDSVCLKSVISKFIGTNKDSVGNELDKHLELGLTGFDIALILEQKPSNSGNIMKKWAAGSVENTNFIVENYSLYHFHEVFPNEDEFTAFVSFISDKCLSVESMKALLNIQSVYFKAGRS